MANNFDQSPPSDVCLLLRAHAEARWLSHEVVPVLRELEQRDSLPNEQLGAALAYLEVLWIEACGRAAETDATRAELDLTNANGDHALHGAHFEAEPPSPAPRTDWAADRRAMGTRNGEQDT